MLLFLDYDGVLRRTGSPLYQLETELVKNLEEVLREVPETRVVITSSWHEVYGLGELRSHFSPDVAERIIGVTPILYSRDNYYRHSEVLAYLKRFRENQPTDWVAIDDDAEHYPPDAPVVIVDPASGLDAAVAGELRLLLTRQH